jgi:hypothetical protein
MSEPDAQSDTKSETGPDSRIVEQTVRISARPETVWRYWTDPQRMCDWWGAAAELDPRPGGACRVEMGGGPVMRGEYLDLHRSGWSYFVPLLAAAASPNVSMEMNP